MKGLSSLIMQVRQVLISDLDAGQQGLQSYCICFWLRQNWFFEVWEIGISFTAYAATSYCVCSKTFGWNNPNPLQVGELDQGGDFGVGKVNMAKSELPVYIPSVSYARLWQILWRFGRKMLDTISATNVGSPLFSVCAQVLGACSRWVLIQPTWNLFGSVHSG